MDIINRNFYRLLLAGAFGEQPELELMSQFKWNRILQIAERQNVYNYVLVGLMCHRHDPSVTLSQAMWEELADKHTTIPDVAATTMTIMQEEPMPSNIFLRHTWRRIIKKDDESDDSSLETQQLLSIIIYNINHTLTSGISLRGIIEMGRYLRQRGDRVDYVRLEQWLHKLGFVRMASLLGTVLIRIFDFTIDELPFMQKEEADGPRLTARSMDETAHDTAENWHFRMHTNGMVENNSRVLRRNLRRSLRYVRYNPLETASNFMANFARSLSEIEE